MPEHEKKGEHRTPALLDLSGKDRGELLQLKTSLGADVDAIRGQLDKAKVDFRIHGKRADDDWYRRAKGMLRVKGRQIQQIQGRLAELKLRRRKGLPQVFMQHAERMLARADFTKILEEALAECDVSKPVSGEELDEEDLS